MTQRLGTMVMALALTACATTNNPKDPLESFNRAIFTFNDTLDQAAVKPAATFYQSVLPSFVQTGVGNFFGNLGDVWTAVNNLMQGKLEDGTSDIMRVALNSTLGLGGLLDIGSEAGMVKHREDFGQTLGKWGVAPGPYVVLPIFGPSTLRDTAAFPIDFKADPWAYKDPVNVRNIGTALRLVDRRAAVLDASNLIEEAALDKYSFVRDAYLQRRASQIRDNGPEPDSDDAVPDYEKQGALPASEEPPAQSAVQPLQHVNVAADSSAEGSALRPDADTPSAAAKINE
jgi:phospholipid-binding lipoprotein MlaA